MRASSERSYGSPAISSVEVPVEGGALAAFRLGAGGAAEDQVPPVLAVHGITSSSHTWLPVARALENPAELVAPDLRGRGRSNALSGPYGVGAHVRDMLAVLDRLHVERTVLVGHSLGAYIAALLAAEHPARVSAVVLVDGGLPVPGSQDADPQEFLDAFLGPTLARLAMTFADPEGYRDWWRAHPAIAGSDVSDGDLIAYADHDLDGEPPRLRSAVREDAVRADAADLPRVGDAAYRLTSPSKLLCAPRGLLDDQHAMQPLALAQAWANDAPTQRQAIQVPDVNHYTIVLGARGARAVADAVTAAVGTP
jgi:pimeloyl-ACP methyl ester carboxylesterase